MILVFVLVWPFSYLVYKALYVHYFLVVMGVTVGLQGLLSKTRCWIFPARYLLYGLALALAAVNLFESR